MKTLTEKYRGVLNESFSKKQFVRDARIAHPQLITQFNGFSDTVSILKQKGMISEEDKMPEYSDYANISDEAIRRGTDAELEAMGLMSHDSISAEDQEKAKKKAIKNIQKDPLHYLNLISGESSKVDKHDKEVEVKKDNHTDKFNGLKKAELKESKSVLSENLEKIKKSISRQLSSKLDAHAVDGVIHDIFTDAEVLQDEQPGTSAIVALYNTSEMYEEEYKDEGKDEELAIAQAITKILEPAYMKSEQESLNEYDQTDAVADYIIKHYTNPKTGKSIIDDDIISDFYRTHPEWEEQADGSEEGMQAVLDNFENYLLANYEMPGDYMQEKVAKSVEDVIDPADYGMIGQGYLKGFNRPHSLDLDQLETLGRKVVDSLYKGDFDKAKAKFVKEVMGIDRLGRPKPKGTSSNYTGGAANMKMKEQMTDQEMADIAKYGREDKPVKVFKPGDMYSSDFDYEGMLEFGMKIRLNTPIATLKALYDSFEDVNYHTENSHLGMAIDAIEAKDKSEALDHIRNFKKTIKQTLVQFNEGANPNRRELEEAGAVISERVGGLQEFISLIEDRAAETGFEPREEAAEVIEALADHYKLNLKMIQNYIDSDGPVNPFAENEGVSEKKVNEEGVEDANYSMDEAFKRYGIDMSKDVIVAEMDGGTPQFGGGKLDIEAAEPAIVVVKRLEKHRLAAIAEYKSDGANGDFPVNYEDGFYGDYTPEGTEHKLTYSEDGGTMWDIFQAPSKMEDDGLRDDPRVDKHGNEEPEDGESSFGEAKGKDHDGDGDVDGDDYMAAKDKAIKKAMGKDEVVKESIKAIITKVLEEGTINEAATQELARMADSYAGFDGMKGVVMSLQDIVTDIERYYDNTRNKIQKAFDSMGEVRNEEGLKVGGFLSPAVESAFNKDLRPVVKQGFTKGLEQPKVKVLSQADLDAARMGGPVAEAEPKQTVFTPVNEKKK